MAQQLVDQGQKVALLVMMDTGPFLGWSVTNLDYKLCQLAKHARGRVTRKLRRGPTLVAAKDKAQQFYVTEQQVKHIGEVMDAHLKAAQNYAMRRVYPGRITLVLSEEFGANRFVRWGWSRLAAEGVDRHIIPGRHTQMFQEPNIQIVADKLRVCLEHAQAAHAC